MGGYLKVLTKGQAAIDDDCLAGDHRAPGAQEEDRLGDVLGLAGALEWGTLDRSSLAVLGPVLVPWAVDKARRHGVDPNLGRQCARERARQIDEARLARRIGDAAARALNAGDRGGVADRAMRRLQRRDRSV